MNWDEQEKDQDAKIRIITRTVKEYNSFNQHQRRIIDLNVKLVKEISDEIKAKMPYNRQRLAVAQSVLYCIVHDCLREPLHKDSMEHEKKEIRLSLLAQMARIMALIDAYPDNALEFNELSHDQFRQYLADEYKKWLT